MFVRETDGDDRNDNDCNCDDILCLTNDQCSPLSVFVAVMLEFLCFFLGLGAIYTSEIIDNWTL